MCREEKIHSPPPLPLCSGPHLAWRHMSYCPHALVNAKVQQVQEVRG
jgi:hypothetical protein